MLSQVSTSLAKSPFYATIPEATRAEMAAASMVQAFGDRVVLMEKGATQSFLFTVIEGQVEVVGEANEDRHTLQISGPGSIFSLPAVVTRSAALTTARTMGHCRVMMTPAHLVRDVLQHDASAAYAALQSVSRWSHSLLRTIHAQRLCSSLERLANWILRQADPERETQDIPIALNKQQIAGLLGMSPESLARNQADLARIGVRIGRSSIRIESLSRLGSMGSPDPILGVDVHPVTCGQPTPP